MLLFLLTSSHLVVDTTAHFFHLPMKASKTARMVHFLREAKSNRVSLVPNRGREESAGKERKNAPVLRLLENNRLVTVEHLIVDLVLVTGQAVHEDGVLGGSSTGEELVGDLVAGKVLQATSGLFLLTHRDPEGGGKVRRGKCWRGGRERMNQVSVVTT
jgi:hypothetical protein